MPLSRPTWLLPAAGRKAGGAAEVWAQRDPRPADPAPRGGKEKKGTPCGCGGSEREVGLGWAAVLGSPGREAAGSGAARLPGPPRQGSSGAGATGARAAARRPTHACVGGKPIAEHVGGSGTASVPARSRERGG